MLSKTLNFSSKHFPAVWISQADTFSIQRDTIVVNISPEPIYIDSKPKFFIPPFKSTILRQINISHVKSAVILEIPELSTPEDIIKQEGWVHLSEVIPDYPSEIPLYKSTQDSVGEAFFDPKHVLKSPSTNRGPENKVKFEVMVNLWFSPPNTDCGIHNEHHFWEVHTQIQGIGHMQKFHEQNKGRVFEDVVLGPGMTHESFAIVDDCGKFIYPWHQYQAETNCVWMAIEYHQVEEEKS